MCSIPFNLSKDALLDEIINATACNYFNHQDSSVTLIEIHQAICCFIQMLLVHNWHATVRTEIGSWELVGLVFLVGFELTPLSTCDQLCMVCIFVRRAN